MPTDAFFHLDRLRCLLETDRDGHSEPYVWALLIWLDDLTGLTDDLYQSDSRVARKGGARQWRVFEALPWPDY